MGSIFYNFWQSRMGLVQLSLFFCLSEAFIITNHDILVYCLHGLCLIILHKTALEDDSEAAANSEHSMAWCAHLTSQL